jgi:solute carrier family 25 oxoglutarate transporter 11
VGHYLLLKQNPDVMAAAAETRPLGKPVIFATSGLGGVLGWIVVHPFNTLAVRMNLSVMGESGAAPKSFVSFASDLVKKEGFGGLYAGLGAGCLRQVQSCCLL